MVLPLVNDDDDDGCAVHAAKKRMGRKELRYRDDFVDRGAMLRSLLSFLT
jgi:hypothetical protein